MCSLGLVYGPIYPLGYLYTAAGLLLTKYTTHYGMRHWYRKPAAV